MRLRVFFQNESASEYGMRELPGFSRNNRFMRILCLWENVIEFSSFGIISFSLISNSVS